MAGLISRQQPDGAPVVYTPQPENIWIDEYLDDKESEFRRYAQIVVKRKWLVLTITLLVVSAVSIWTFTRSRVYTASVNIQIDPDQNVLPYKEMSAAVIPDPRYLGTQAQVLKSEVLARRTVARLKLTTDSEEEARLARWFASNLVVTPVEGTQVVKVAYNADDPEFAAKAVNIMADEYVVYGAESKRESIGLARDFLQSELIKLQTKLQESEQRLVDYARAHNILVPDQNNNAITRKLTELNDELTKVEGELMANRYDDLQSTPLESFPEKLRTPVMRELDTRRSELEQKLATATMRFGPKWPEVLALNQQLEEVRSQQANEKKKALRQAKVEYDLAVAHRSRLTGALQTQGRLADQLTQDSIGFDMLKREVETDRQLHEGLLQRLKETDVSAGLKSGNVHVIDRGHVPTLPTSPNVPLNLALSLAFGMIAGVACASAVELLDRSIKTPEDVERELRIPFLAAIPSFEKSWKEANGGHLVPLDREQPALTAPDVASSVYWESYRALRTSLLFSPDRRPHSILVTSSLPGEGKSTSSVNLGIALAQTGARTIILELDMRRPRLAARLALQADRGMSRYLSGQSHFHTEIQQSSVPNLFVVTAGPIPPNPPELLGSPRMAKILALLERHFDYVVIDGPPVAPLTDALIISSLVNGVVLVVDSPTPKEVALRARNLLRSVDARLLGVLINNVKMDPRSKYYSEYFTSRPVPPDAKSLN